MSAGAKDLYLRYWELVFRLLPGFGVLGPDQEKVPRGRAEWLLQCVRARLQTAT